MIRLMRFVFMFVYRMQGAGRAAGILDRAARLALRLSARCEQKGEREPKSCLPPTQRVSYPTL